VSGPVNGGGQVEGVRSGEGDIAIYRRGALCQIPRRYAKDRTSLSRWDVVPRSEQGQR
jgi:hypothetical protein